MPLLMEMLTPDLQIAGLVSKEETCAEILEDIPYGAEVAHENEPRLRCA